MNVNYKFSAAQSIFKLRRQKRTEVNITSEVCLTPSDRKRCLPEAHITCFNLRNEAFSKLGRASHQVFFGREGRTRHATLARRAHWSSGTPGCLNESFPAATFQLRQSTSTHRGRSFRAILAVLGAIQQFTTTSKNILL